MAKLPDNPSMTLRKLNPHIYGDVAQEAVLAAKFVERVIGKAKRLRQDPKPLMNKLEQRLFDYLQRLYPRVKLHAQAKRFRLANGLWYKPDITAVIDGRETAWEAKGPHAFRGGFENLKFAATAWPEVRWLLVWKNDDGWRTQEVIP